MEYNDKDREHIEVNADLIKLVKLIDQCMEDIDNFYCYTMKRQMLMGSNDN